VGQSDRRSWGRGGKSAVRPTRAIATPSLFLGERRARTRGNWDTLYLESEGNALSLERWGSSDQGVARHHPLKRGSGLNRGSKWGGLKVNRRPVR